MDGALTFMGTFTCTCICIVLLSIPYRLRGVKAWVSKCSTVIIFMMGGASVSVCVYHSIPGKHPCTEFERVNETLLYMLRINACNFPSG